MEPEKDMILYKHFSWTKTLAAFVLVLFSALVAFGQSQETGPVEPQAPVQDQDSSEPPEPPGGTHVFGVLPNFRTVNESEVKGPLTTHQKFAIASKDSFDYPLVLLAGGLAGINQWADENHSFGQGMSGFGKRLVTAYADQALGNMMTEGFMPAMLHEDPRYYRRGSGGTWSRTGYSFSRIFVTHTESGRKRFNYSEWIGNSVAVAISNAYYPDGRTVGNNAVKLIEQCGLDGIAQVLKEFWPDIKQKFFERSPGPTPGH
jgi:hypothetical protein